MSRQDAILAELRWLSTIGVGLHNIGLAFATLIKVLCYLVENTPEKPK